MAHSCNNGWLTPDESWNLKEWSTEQLVAALSSNVRERSQAVAMELLRRNEQRAAVPLAVWALARSESEAWMAELVASWMLRLPAGAERAEGLGLIARAPDERLQKVLVRGCHRR